MARLTETYMPAARASVIKQGTDLMHGILVRPPAAPAVARHVQLLQHCLCRGRAVRPQASEFQALAEALHLSRGEAFRGLHCQLEDHQGHGEVLGAEGEGCLDQAVQTCMQVHCC